MQKMKFVTGADKVLKLQQQKFLHPISVLGTFAMILFSSFVCLFWHGFFWCWYFFFFSYCQGQRAGCAGPS